MAVSAVQPVKAPAPMLVTLFGMSTLVSAAQPAKAKSPIVFRPSGS